MANDQVTRDGEIPGQNPIWAVGILGGLNLLAASAILALQAGIVITGKAVGLAHLALAAGWAVTGVLGVYLLLIAQSLAGKRRQAIETAKKAANLEHTRELQRESFTFFEG